MSEETKPRVLVVYYTLTNQAGRVAEAMAQALEARGCDVAKASIEFTDERWLPHLSQFPMTHPIRQLVTILPAQARHKTGEIRIPPEAQTGDYDLVVLASPTWWFQTSMPIRSYLESPAAKTVLSGKPFACASISRRYYSINLGQQKKLGEKNGGRFMDKTHFVCAGGQVKSMLAVARVHEARRAARAGHGAEDVPAQPQTRLRGAGESVRRRPCGQRSPAADPRGWR